jgi:ribulose-bisphosphate carboxylase large chain
LVAAGLNTASNRTRGDTLSDDLIITYRVRATADEITRRVEGLLLEQTVELPRSAIHDAFVRGNIVGSVVGIEQLAEASYRVQLAQPAVTTASEPAQLLNVLFGNSSLQPDIELDDVTIPAQLEAIFGGPRFGIVGLRKLTDVEQRALTCAALKPMGLNAPQLAELCHSFALAGIDVIKDDHGLADHEFAPFAERVVACQRAVARAAQTTGRHAHYVPNLIGAPFELKRQLAFAQKNGVSAVMLSPMLVGLPSFYEIVRKSDVPVLAHPAFAGAQRISPVALLGKLFPLFGADAVIFPSYGGRFSYSELTCCQLATTLREPQTGHSAALPIPAGGIRTDRVKELLGTYGNDVMLLVGTSLLHEPSKILERSRHFVEQVAVHSAQA